MTRNLEIEKNPLNSIGYIEEKQPKTLTLLFCTEMWERFSFWSVQSLLVLFMVRFFHFDDTSAYAIFSAFTALQLATPVIGGYISDRFIGGELAVTAGAITLSLGYVLLSFTNQHIYFLALSLLVCGNGLLKPNISSLLGACYRLNDTRRSNGFTLFYLGINVGSLLGVIISGIIATYLSWQLAFLADAFAMILGLIVFLSGLKQLHKDQLHASTLLYKGYKTLGIVIVLLLMLYPLNLLLNHASIANDLLLVVAIILIIYLIYITIQLRRKEQKKFIVCLLLILFSIAFWSLYQQMGMALTLFTARDINLQITSHITIPPSIASAFIGIFIIVLTPAIIQVWKYLRKRNIEPTYIGKFIIGIIFIAVAYWTLAFTASIVTPDHPAPFPFIVLVYLLQTIGELSLSPIGLAMISELSPKNIVSTKGESSLPVFQINSTISILKSSLRYFLISSSVGIPAFLLIIQASSYLRSLAN